MASHAMVGSWKMNHRIKEPTHDWIVNWLWLVTYINQQIWSRNSSSVAIYLSVGI
jgi:hypothetical protein